MYASEKKILTQTFPVIKDFGENEPFFRLQTEHGEAQLMKLPFQLGQPLPDTLSCRVKGYKGAMPIVLHNMPLYVNEFYADGFSSGRAYEFKVVGKSSGAGAFYWLVDDKGLQFKLKETNAALVIGQTVKCKFSHLNPDFYMLRRALDDTQLSMITPADIARVVGVKPSTIDKALQAMGDMPELASAMSELDHGMPSWTMAAARAMKAMLPKWFSQQMAARSYELVRSMLEGYKRVLLYLLEGSGFLRNVKGEDRIAMQAELTSMIEQADIFIRAYGIIRDKEQKTFINNLLTHLKESGYIFHPTEQFSIMMILFRTSPELVNSSLGSIFDTLMGWYPDTWKSEPFRQAFVEQLEIYISETRDEIDSFLLPETAADNEKIEKVLTAIAIQNFLAKESDDIDMRLNMSLFYRCLSLLRRAKADTLLNKSYLALMDVKLPTDFTWLDIKEPTMMMTRAAVDPPANAKVSDESSKYFVAGNLEVEANSGITVRRIDEDADPQVPNGVLPWLNLQVCASNAKPFTPKKIKSLEGHVDFWNDIEDALFNIEEKEVFSATKITPDIDDEVLIEIDRIIYSASEPNKIEAFHCVIVDEQFAEGDGVIQVEDLVTYNLHGVGIGVFRNAKGKPMRFYAKVIDVYDNDTVRFSLIDRCRMAIPDMTYCGDVCYAVVTKDNGRNYSAISDKGFGLFVKKDPGMPQFRNGNVLHCSITGIGNTVEAVVEDGPVDSVFINNANSLHKLMEAIAVEDEDDAPDIDLDEEITMPREDLVEIAQALRYKAVSKRENIIEAYDYLSYAHILARILGDTKLQKTIKAHRDMLMLHQHYAKNKSVYADDIAAIEQQAPDSLLIKRLAAKLRIVACLGKTDENGWLWSLSASSTDETEKELARMVLSHNLLTEVNRDDATAKAILDKIANTLNVSSEQRNLKYYGSESQYVEFKSSLVYPAHKGKSGISVADPDKQEFEIMHIIAGFLNTTGGTLYIGVSDDHYERGLEEDMKFYKLDSSERNTPHRRSIKSLDNMANYLQQVIDRSFNIGANAGDYAKTFVDDESTKGVIAVKVDPCPHVVTLDGTIYARHGAKTEPYVKPEEIERFKADRSRIFKLQPSSEGMKQEMPQAVPDAAVPAPEAAKQAARIVVPEAGEMEVKSIEASLVPDYSAGPQTSAIRKNVLHEYADPEHFVTPRFYIRFVGDHEYAVTDDEWSLDDNDLNIAISDEEAAQYLVLVYEGEAAIKVPMREIEQKRKNTSHSFYADKKLVFASPMGADDGLYCLLTNAKGTVYERLTMLDDIQTGSMTSTPARILETDCDSALWEAVPAQRAGEFDNVKSSTLKRTQIGVLAKGVKNGKDSVSGAADVFYSKFK